MIWRLSFVIFGFCTIHSWAFPFSSFQRPAQLLSQDTVEFQTLFIGPPVSGGIGVALHPEFQLAYGLSEQSTWIVRSDFESLALLAQFYPSQLWGGSLLPFAGLDVGGFRFSYLAGTSWAVDFSWATVQTWIGLNNVSLDAALQDLSLFETAPPSRLWLIQTGVGSRWWIKQNQISWSLELAYRRPLSTHDLLDNWNLGLGLNVLFGAAE